MTKEETLEYKGVVVKLLPNAMFQIKLENGHMVTAVTAGKLRKNRIRILDGDSVSVSVSPYDLTRGRVIFRY